MLAVSDRYRDVTGTASELSLIKLAFHLHWMQELRLTAKLFAAALIITAAGKPSVVVCLLPLLCSSHHLHCKMSNLTSCRLVVNVVYSLKCFCCKPFKLRMTFCLCVL